MPCGVVPFCMIVSAANDNDPAEFDPAVIRPLTGWPTIQSILLPFWRPPGQGSGDGEAEHQ